jgi:hypothetical protein
MVPMASLMRMRPRFFGDEVGPDELAEAQREQEDGHETDGADLR